MNKFHSIEQALADLKLGKIIILVDDIHRENEGDFVMAAQFATPETINFMITHGRGLVCAPLNEAMATQLDLIPMVSHNSDTFRTAFTISVDALETTTGIAAHERAYTIQQLANPSSKPTHFKKPGHVFPLIAKAGGVLTRPGHTEASIDLMQLASLNPVAVICEILNADGSMARRPELLTLAQQWNMVMITIEDLKQYIQGGHHG
jgi:3,4-dihydroxy 2-butanone 4-phosphate synthase/GTP cyclohydrolase II